MKSTRYTAKQKRVEKPRTIGVILLFLSFFFGVCPAANACGPYENIIPTPEFFAFAKKASQRDGADFEKAENLLLWQNLTSDRIPLSDIENAVYKASSFEVEQAMYVGVPTDNAFFNYLRNANDYEITSFLLTAKNLEERRRNICSPWYYPPSRERADENGDFSDIIELCKSYRGTRLRDRYALQAVRASFAERDWQDCIDLYEEMFRDYPDDNLFKRMAMRYVAGCWLRLDNEDKAYEYFAKAGDFYSIANSRGAGYMARLNADAPELMEYIRGVANDSAAFCALKPVAEYVLDGKKTKFAGDWLFTLAYMQGEHLNDDSRASALMAKAVDAPFSSPELADLARAYRFKLDARRGDTSRLLADLRWFETKIDLSAADGPEWNRRLQNVVYVDLVPYFWEKGDYATAILLCGYADNLLASRQKFYAFDCRDDKLLDFPYCQLTLDEMRRSVEFENLHDFRTLSFRLMESLTSSQLADAKNRIVRDNGQLYARLKKYARTDAPYFDELIGTLALREDNYDRAAEYLARVPLDYQKTLNIYKSGYLSRDPLYDDFTVINRIASAAKPKEFGVAAYNPLPNLSDNAKLNFARMMARYKRQMESGRTADERGLARLRHAIARRNARDYCWALTHYSYGYIPRFSPRFEYWEDCYDRYAFLETDEETADRHTAELFESEVAAALQTLVTDEARAEANYILGNLATVVRRYPDTRYGRLVKTSCDTFSSWL